MTADDTLMAMIDALEQAVADCSAVTRAQCQAQLHRMIGDLEQAGHPVPARLHELDALLTDAGMEDAFDNLPI